MLWTVSTANNKAWVRQASRSYSDQVLPADHMNGPRYRQRRVGSSSEERSSQAADNTLMAVGSTSAVDSKRVAERNKSAGVPQTRHLARLVLVRVRCPDRPNLRCCARASRHRASHHRASHRRASHRRASHHRASHHRASRDHLRPLEMPLRPAARWKRPALSYASFASLDYAHGSNASIVAFRRSWLLASLNLRGAAYQR